MRALDVALKREPYPGLGEFQGGFQLRKASEDALVGFEDEKELACLKGKLGGRE